jgi:hypothetical protein
MLRIFGKAVLPALAVICLIAACAPEAHLTGAAQQAPAASGSPQGMQLSLPLPSQLPASGKTFSTMPEVLRAGKDFSTLLPNNRTTAVSYNADFAPAWDGATKTFDHLAYCMYEYHPVSYSYNAQIRYHWTVPLTNINNGWIGLANWVKDRWDWYPITATNKTDLSSFISYFNVMDSNRCIVTVVCCGADPAELRWIRLGSTPPVAAVNASKTMGPSPVSVGFDPSASYDPDTADDPSASIVKYEWDLEPDGVFEVTTTTPDAQIHLYSAAAPGATFFPELRVTDNDGLTNSTTVAVYVLYPWTHSWGNTESETITAVAQDAAGDIYTTGYTKSYGTSATSLLLTAYGPDGACFWKEIWYGASTTKSETGTAIAVDNAGNLYVVGNTTSYGEGNNDVLIQKWTTSGNLLWTYTWGGLADDTAAAVAVAGSGIYVMGTACSWEPNGDACLLKFDTAGGLVWQYTWGSPLEETAGGLVQTGAAPDAFAGVGTTYGYASSYDAFSFRFDEDGAISQALTFGDSNPQLAKTVAVDPAGNLYIAGQSWISGADYGLLLYKIDSTGSLVFNTTWDAPGEDCISSLVRQADGLLWAAGHVDGSGTPRGILAAFENTGAFSGAEKWYTDGSPTFFNGVLNCPYSGLVLVGKCSSATGGIWDPVVGTVDSLASATLATPPITPVACSGTLTEQDVSGWDVPAGFGTDDTGGGKYDVLIMYRAP